MSIMGTMGIMGISHSNKTTHGGDGILASRF